MPTIHICPICKKKFHSRRQALEHVKIKHYEKIKAVLSKLRDDKIRNLQKKGINPENWAAGIILSYFTV